MKTIINNRNYAERMEKLVIGMRNNVITFFLPYSSDAKYNFLCMDFKKPIKLNNLVFSNSLSLYGYMYSLWRGNSILMDYFANNDDILKVKKKINESAANDAEWLEKWCYIAVKISQFYKFLSSSPSMENLLSSTGNMYIAYCNPMDRILGTFTTRVQASRKISCAMIEGKNVLGNSIMEVRDIIRSRKTMKWFPNAECKKESSIMVTNVSHSNLFLAWIEVVMAEFCISDSMYHIEVIADNDGLSYSCIKIKCDFSDFDGEEVHKKIISRIGLYPDIKFM